jgi:hypothetical protein
MKKALLFAITLSFLSGCGSNCKDESVISQLTEALSNDREFPEYRDLQVTVSSSDKEYDKGEICKVEASYRFVNETKKNFNQIVYTVNEHFKRSGVGSMHAITSDKKRLSDFGNLLTKFNLNKSEINTVSLTLFHEFKLHKKESVGGSRGAQFSLGSLHARDGAFTYNQLTSYIDSNFTPLISRYAGHALNSGYMGVREKEELESTYQRYHTALASAINEREDLRKNHAKSLKLYNKTKVDLSLTKVKLNKLEKEAKPYLSFLANKRSFILMEGLNIDIDKIDEGYASFDVTVTITNNMDHYIGRITLEGFGNNEATGVYELPFSMIHLGDGVGPKETKTVKFEIDSFMSRKSVMNSVLFKRAKKHSLYLYAEAYENGLGEKVKLADYVDLEVGLLSQKNQVSSIQMIIDQEYKKMVKINKDNDKLSVTMADLEQKTKAAYYALPEYSQEHLVKNNRMQSIKNLPLIKI